MCDSALCNRSNKKDLFVPIIDKSRKTSAHESKSRFAGKKAMYLVKTR